MGASPVRTTASRRTAPGRVRPQDELHIVAGDLDHEPVALTEADWLLQAAVGFGPPRPILRHRKLLTVGATWDEARAAAEPLTPRT